MLAIPDSGVDIIPSMINSSVLCMLQPTLRVCVYRTHVCMLQVLVPADHQGWWSGGEPDRSQQGADLRP